MKTVYLFLIIIFFFGVCNAETKKAVKEEKPGEEAILWSEEKGKIATDPAEEGESEGLVNPQETAYGESKNKDADKFSAKEKIVEQQLKKDTKNLDEK